MLQSFSKRLYCDKTHRKLNYLTLHVKDAEIEEELKERRVDQVRRHYWPFVLLTSVSFAKSLYLTFVEDNGHPVMVIQSSLLLVLVLLVTIHKL